MHLEGHLVVPLDRAAELLAAQLTAPVRWIECVQRSVELAGPDAAVYEIGPGKVLTGLVRRITPDVRTVNLGTADQLTAFLETA